VLRRSAEHPRVWARTSDNLIRERGGTPLATEESGSPIDRRTARQLATALTVARRAKHQPLNEAARGDDADRALAGELLRELELAVASFTTLERQAFAHALVGWSSGETARRLGVARKSADNTLQRARRKVGEWYERQAA
jgi:DNA-directed RNA polymerase specialized sigma24 family protein